LSGVFGDWSYGGDFIWVFTQESFESSWSRIGLITIGFIHYKLKELEEYEKKVALIE
jgi:hypothetical protein